MQDPISVPTSQFQPAINLQAHHQQQQQQQQDEESPAVKCPRCESTNTKFCYYNNYNLSQPRHFCKSCRRYWTKGGSLRNIPVGGGTRKNSLKRASDPSSSSAPEPKRPKTPPPPVVIVADSDKQCAEDKLMDVNGSSFSSLLEGEGQFSNLLIDADSGEHDLNLLNWTWTDLAI